MAGKWVKVKLDQIKAQSPNAIAMGPFGSRIKTDNFVPSGVPVIRGGNLNAPRLLDDGFVFLTEAKADELRASNARPGDIVITHRGTIGQVGIIPYDAHYPRYVVSQSQMKLTVDVEKADPFFIYYFLRSAIGQYQLLANTSQVGVPAIAQPTSSLKAIEVLLPPTVDEQRAIANILRTLDDKIELNRRINETLEAIARALFKSWFVDFDPVRAKMSGEPSESICQRLGLTSDLLALFPDRLVDSELGEIPEGWDVSSIGNEVSIFGGATPSTSNPDYWNGEYTWVTPKDLSAASEKVLVSSERKITQAGVNKISSGQLSTGTVLLSSRAPIGYLALAMIPVSINQGFIAMVCDKRLPNTYVLQWAIENLDAIKQRGSGTTFAEISKTNFRPMRMLVPSEHVLKAFQQQAMPLYEQITAKVRESGMIATVRDALLPKLLSGELRVSKADSNIEVCA